VVYWYNETKPSLSFPVAWPQVSSFTWLTHFGSPVLSIGVNQQRAATWTD